MALHVSLWVLLYLCFFLSPSSMCIKSNNGYNHKIDLKVSSLLLIKCWVIQHVNTHFLFMPHHQLIQRPLANKLWWRVVHLSILSGTRFIVSNTWFLSNNVLCSSISFTSLQGSCANQPYRLCNGSWFWPLKRMVLLMGPNSWQLSMPRQHGPNYINWFSNSFIN